MSEAITSDRCPTCWNTGHVERPATPDEVDEGYELGVSFDPCPNEAWHNPPRCATCKDEGFVTTHYKDDTGCIEYGDVVCPDCCAVEP